MSEETLSTKERLARAIEARSPNKFNPRVQLMIRQARQGYYDEFDTELATPIVQLVNDLRSVGFQDLVQRAIDGEFDCTKEEGEAWMQRQGWDLLKGDKKAKGN